MIRTVIADDDSDLRLLIATALRLDGRFEVVGAAADGSEAIELVLQQDPDLLVLDLAMPNKDGLEVLADLQGRPRPPIVVMSGFSHQDMIERAMELGAADYVTKGRDLDGIPGRLAATVAAA